MESIPNKGAISIFGSFLGKPGDTLSYLLEVKQFKNRIELIFKDGILIIKEPINIILDQDYIEIDSKLPVQFQNKIYLPKVTDKAFRLFTW
ncbi:MAG: hypothetical protein ACTIJ9_11390 [Aequorivita sp.]